MQSFYAEHPKFDQSIAENSKYSETMEMSEQQ